ncbi:hypothetical protein KIH74_03415 [Kineosporia sp. J2-2]|uniref:Hemolysin-type calcium-binding repeat-containing protein n=1 Tax=Kineosporia corallincola TaxID=2835133 RepID=A0ABS5TA72_9ACTN|nr:hypothetical protein [Kineosporia corallincola]MBT0767956.1 hypothetical protein [Kineosporia corallincola]
MALRRNRLTALMGTASVVAVGLTPLLFAGSAQAVVRAPEASVLGSPAHHYQLYFDGGSEIANQIDLTLELSADESTFTYTIDDVVDIEIGDFCVYPDSADHTRVACELENLFGDDRVANDPNGNLYLGDGDDSLTFTNRTTFDITGIGLGDGDNTYATGDPAAPDAYVYAEGGKDTFTIGTGGFVSAGLGDDVINLVGGAATAYGSFGNDEINGGSGDDQLYGDEGDDVIYGNDGDDYIAGGKGNDQLFGGRHNDTIYGNSGDDVIYGNSGDDYISGGPGTDTISGGTGTNTIVD